MRLTLLRTLLIWAAVWPLVTGLLLLIAQFGRGLHLGLQTFFLTALLVPLISLVLAPRMHGLAMRILKGEL